MKITVFNLATLLSLLPLPIIEVKRLPSTILAASFPLENLVRVVQFPYKFSRNLKNIKRVFFVSTYWQMQCDIFNRNECHVIATESQYLVENQFNGADGGDGGERVPLQEEHGADLNYKKVLGVAP